MVLDAFVVPHTISKLSLLSHPSKPLANQSQCILESFKKEINKMLQAGVLKPVHQATPWFPQFCSHGGEG